MQVKCSIPDCDKPTHNFRGWCTKHYQRWRKHGNPLTTLTPFRDDAERRFWAQVEKTDTCWLWVGVRNWAGYGRFSYKGRFVQAHRFAYELERGSIPDGLTIDHLCRTRACIRAIHMEAVTIKVNVLRGHGVTAANVKKTHCPQGHPYSAENTYIARRGSRTCRTCNLAAGRRWWARTH